MNTTWNIQKRIAAGFAAVVLLAGALGGFSLLELSRIEKTTTFMAQDPYPGTVAIYEIEAGSMEEFGAVARLVLAPAAERAARAAELDTTSGNVAKANHAYDITMTVDEDRAMFAKLGALRATYDRIAGDIKTHVLAGRIAEATALLNAELNPAFDALHHQIDVMSAWNRKNAEEALARIDSSVHEGIVGDGIALGVTVLLAVVAAFWIIRSVRKALVAVSGSIAAGAEQVAAASGQVSSSSQALASGASEQAASLEESSSSLEEMSSMTKRNADAAVKAAQLAAEARAAADAGSAEVSAMSRAMHEIKASSDEVAKIVKTIDELAFQTNILALNAAVEAARAGEAGLGFAVVADEVRNLAQRSAQASKETAAKIESAIARTSQGVALSDKVGTHLGTIVSRVRQVDELVAEVATASREQSEGVQQINAAVSDMDKVVQTNAASAEESAAAAEELNQQAAALNAAVETLRHLAGADTRGGAAPGPVVEAEPAVSFTPRPVHVRRPSPQPAPVAASPRRPALHRAPSSPHHTRPASVAPAAAGSGIEFFN